MRYIRIAPLLAIAAVVALAAPARAAQNPTPTPAPAATRTPITNENLDVPFPLPATFQGTTACADCPGIRVTITLNADGTYYLEREYLERPARSHENGQWGYDKSKSLLTLYPPSNGNPQFFSINVNPTLQTVDAQGKPIPTSANFSYAPWLTFADAPLPLEATPWRLSEIAGKPVAAADASHAPALRFDAAEKRISGSGGCNRITGTYELNANKLHFGPIASTRMACPQPIMDAETAFLRILPNVATYKIEDAMLSFYGADGSVLAKFRPEK